MPTDSIWVSIHAVSVQLYTMILMEQTLWRLMLVVSDWHCTHAHTFMNKHTV